MISIDDMFDGLIKASFRGVPFWMPNSRETVGRRVAKFLFPGRNDRVYEDLGAFDGPITFPGVLIGDDFVEQAQAMRAALRTPGRALLLHPWFGELDVILVEPGTVSVDQHSLRVARIEMTVELFRPDQPPPTDTVAAINAASADLGTQANNLLAAVMAPVELAVAAIGTGLAVCAQVAGVFQGVVGVAGVIASAASAAVAGLLAVGDLAIDATLPAALGAALAAPGAAIALTSETLLPAAVGPGDLPLPSPPQDPKVTTGILINATTQIVALVPAGTGTAPAGAVALAAGALTVISAISAASDIVFDSQTDAQYWCAQQLVAIDAVAGLAVALAPNMPSTAGAVWRSLQALRATVIADINAVIGRLPVVQTYTLLDSTPAWLVAQALVGDTPAAMLGMYLDLVNRNNVANPTCMGPGAIEALVAA